MARRFLALFFVVASAATLSAEQLDRQEVEFFEKKIRPVLVAQCYKCHSADAKEIEGKLRLDSREALLAGGESGPAIVVGNPKDSLLIQALRHDGLEMPPERKLPAETIADFERWISRGAVDPRVGDAVAAPAKKEIDLEAARQFWSLRPIAKPQPPAVKNAAWPRTDIDRFVLAKLEEKQLAPVADADKLTLLRRLSFDLTGLPPTPEEAQAFLSDESPTAVANLVDRLLASPHFGEHWGRHWLDVARYAESNGNVDNFLFPHAWRYRDYVIAALNEDRPLDRFITEQVAGDLLPATNPQQRNELLTATGFLALTSKPRQQNNPDYTMDLVAEQVEVTTVGFMGLTVACARCHDHKFDPIAQREFYSLAAIFESSQMLHGGGNRQGNQVLGRAGLHALASDDPEVVRQVQQQQARLADLKAQETDTRRKINQLIAGKKLASADLDGDAEAPAAKASKKNKKKNAVIDKKLERQIERAADKLGEKEKQQLATLKDRLLTVTSEIEELESGPSAGGFAMGVADAKQPVEGRIRLRGESQKLGDTVPRGFVTVASLATPPTPAAEQSGRLELAQWITSPDNPLTARVMANRVWRHLFGRGIVSTVDNFGALGEKPTHPELLDHLATQLVADEWSLKQLIRTIVLSRTYQLSSTHDPRAKEIDPDNTLLWRHSVRRLEGESLRDAILVASGQLVRTPLAGSPVAKSGNIEVRNGTDRQFSQHQHNHRSIYLPVVRNAEPEMLALFDLPDTELVIGDRSVTTVPAQSLFLLNSPWMIEQSKAMAQRLLADADATDEQRIAHAYQLAMARDARPEELQRLTAYLRSQEGADTPAKQLQVWSRACQAILASAEFRYIE